MMPARAYMARGDAPRRRHVAEARLLSASAATPPRYAFRHAATMPLFSLRQHVTADARLR